MAVLEAIEANSGRLGPPPAPKVDVLVLDCVSSVLQPILGGGGSGNSFAARGYVLASHLACALSRVADRFCIAVVITNHMVAGGGADSEGVFGQKVALGESGGTRFSWPREARGRRASQVTAGRTSRAYDCIFNPISRPTRIRTAPGVVEVLLETALCASPLTLTAAPPRLPRKATLLRHPHIDVRAGAVARYEITGAGIADVPLT